MWRFVVLVAVAAVLGGGRVTSLPALDLDKVADIVSGLEALPAEEREDDTVSPELADLYRDVELLWELQKSNLTESREGRGLLSKLSFLTGLKLGGILNSSGTLAASNSINFLGKVLNTALSVSYGNVGNYGGVEGEFSEIPPVGLQQLPVIQGDVPQGNKKRERPDSAPQASESATTTNPGAAREEFLRVHNRRVDKFNNAFEKKLRGRTGRVET